MPVGDVFMLALLVAAAYGVLGYTVALLTWQSAQQPRWSRPQWALAVLFGPPMLLVIWLGLAAARLLPKRHRA